MADEAAVLEAPIGDPKATSATVEAAEVSPPVETPVPEPEPDPLAELADEAIAASPRVAALLDAKAKDLEARHGQSIKDVQTRLEREAQDRILSETSRVSTEAALRVQSGETVGRLSKLLRDASETGAEVDQKAVLEAANDLQAFHRLSSVTELTSSFNQQLARFQGFEIPKDLGAEYARAEMSGDVRAMSIFGTRVLEAAIRSDERKSVLEEMTRTETDKAQAEAEAESLRKAEVARKTQQGPTSLNGKPAPKFMTHTELDANYTSQQWANLPAADRQRLLSEADQAEPQRRS